jgi:hypothetical protein
MSKSSRVPLGVAIVCLLAMLPLGIALLPPPHWTLRWSVKAFAFALLYAIGRTAVDVSRRGRLAASPASESPAARPVSGDGR